MKKVRWVLLVLALILGVSFTEGVTQAKKASNRGPEVKIYTAAGQKTGSFYPFAKPFTNGGTVAMGDINGDGVAEIIGGAGAGQQSWLRIYTAQGRYTGLRFLAYDKKYKEGVEVTTGDVNGDGKAEIIVGRTNQGSLVKVLRLDTTLNKIKVVSAFRAFKQSKVGTYVASGDINGDAKDEIVVGAGIGYRRPQVKVFDGRGKYTGVTFQPFENSFKGGVAVAVGKVGGLKKAEIVTARAAYGRTYGMTTEVKVYRIKKKASLIGHFNAFDGYRMGVNLAVANIDKSKAEEIIIGSKGEGRTLIKAFQFNGKAKKLKIKPYSASFKGGVDIAAGKVDSLGQIGIIAVSQPKYWSGRPYYKYVEVSVAHQKLKFYENSKLVKEFLVSTGIAKYPSPVGDFYIWGKTPLTRMKHEYGPNHPDNYDLPNVPYVMYFHEGYALHGTYWHNNFGYPMSHGCINLATPNAQWLFARVDVGTPVFVTPW